MKIAEKLLVCGTLRSKSDEGLLDFVRQSATCLFVSTLFKPDKRPFDSILRKKPISTLADLSEIELLE